MHLRLNDYIRNTTYCFLNHFPLHHNFLISFLLLQNVVSRLFMREIHGPSARSKARNHRGKLVNTARGFYMNVYPNYTLVNVEKPPCFLRKFTPCGKYFIAFSMCQTSLEIYRFHGAGAAGEADHNLESRVRRTHDEERVTNGGDRGR